MKYLKMLTILTVSALMSLVVLPTGAFVNAQISDNPNGVLFSSFSAKVKAHIGPNQADDKLKLTGEFTLGQGSNGLDPLSVPVTIKSIGPDLYKFTIPAGSFSLVAYPHDPELYKFKGIIDGAFIKMDIKSLGCNNYAFTFNADGLNLSSYVSPELNCVSVGLSIGNDFGETYSLPEIK